VREGGLKISGAKANVEACRDFIRYFVAYVRSHKSAPDTREIHYLLKNFNQSEAEGRAPQESDITVVPHIGKTAQIGPETRGQRAYVEAIKQHDIVVGIGPAGTGKTYLAMAVAVATLQAHGCKRIVLTRPAVEAGERLGFLPGDLVEKVNPYLRPLYDALFDLMDVRRAGAFVKDGLIEVAPLAFMRGRTLNDAFVILDEAQNTTVEQMKMFLTRIGQSSRAVVTGDVTQVDLPDDVPSGLIHAESILQGVPGLGFARLERVDIVRHPLVQEIVRAYDEADARTPSTRPRRRRSDHPA
jgi:phosphate starvation-inducible PhoH-like protein